MKKALTWRAGKCLLLKGHCSLVLVGANSENYKDGCRS